LQEIQKQTMAIIKDNIEDVSAKPTYSKPEQSLIYLLILVFYTYSLKLII